MNDPLVYVIILTWNQKQDTLACLASLARATYSCFRIVLVDNGSADGTAEEVREVWGNITSSTLFLLFYSYTLDPESLSLQTQYEYVKRRQSKNYL
jgi:cellulose synthase/poly-beta-1,6-N-acetylglucosamine synthase-like glycosyltransferase